MKISVHIVVNQNIIVENIPAQSAEDQHYGMKQMSDEPVIVFDHEESRKIQDIEKALRERRQKQKPHIITKSTAFRSPKR